MNRIAKCAAVATLAGACAMVMATPSQAYHGHNAAAAIGFGAGVLTGAAVANAANQGYYYGPDYYYGPGPYAYDAPAYQSYAYEPPPAYAYGDHGCWHVTDSSRGYGYWGACTPGSQAVR
jgi:hypothetical protein